MCACCNHETPTTVALHCNPSIEICSDCLDWLVQRRDKQERAAGPVRIVFHDAIFPVRNVARALDHYRKLGFETDTHDETYGFASRDNLTIHLELSDGSSERGAVYLHVTDADALAEAWRRAGLEVAGPEDFDYGKREGSHRDRDGNLIRFGSPLA